MQYQKFQNKYVLRLDKGEEVIKTLKNFCEKEKIILGQVYAIGAVNQAEIGLFDADKKEYYSKKLKGNFEVSPLYGNVSTMQNEIYLHLHINLCDKEHKSWGGHLNSAIVSATLEIILEKIEGQIDRKFSQEIGLNLIKF